MELVPTPSDYANLFRVNPLAAEQLKSIVLTRLLEEQLAKKPISDADSKPARAADKR